MDLFNRELSWLSFNERVLQEALDLNTPLIERIRFLGIYSNNLDEFFRVRVATVRRLAVLNVKKLEGFPGTAEALLIEVKKEVLKQQQLFELAYENILTTLKKNGIVQCNEINLRPSEQEYVREYFQDVIRARIAPIILSDKMPFPHLNDDAIYLAVKMVEYEKKKVRYAIIEIPKSLNRFVVLPFEKGEIRKVMLIDDIIRFGLKDVFSIFNFDKIDAYTFKITRDAELDIEDDILQSFLEKMKKSVALRKEGDPVRMVYDASIPIDLLHYLINELDLLVGENIIPGGKYHNFKDFMGFPDFGMKELVFPKLKPLEHPVFKNSNKSILKTILNQDVLLTYPFQKFQYLVDLLQEAAIDPKVQSIKVNLYRVAKDSQIINSLICATRNGKKVTVVIELLARFDEENNMKWAKYLENNDVQVIFGVPGLKVHSKLILIKRKTGNKVQSIAHVGTGNFHEKTAEIYTDYGLLTANSRITKEVDKVFKIFKSNIDRSLFRELIVSPFSSRRKFNALIEQEIKMAKNGEEAYIELKLNNLVDSKLIKKLYEASNAGVQIKCIVRGICAVKPGVKGLSENIEVRSVVGRFLEHTRLFIFSGGGSPKYFISSADWMERNIDKRIEVTCPILDKGIQKDLKEMFDTYWADNVKSRIIDVNQKNKYYSNDNPKKINAQMEVYQNFKKKLKG
ncbi:polyphosphate kinase 1 [Putridiphycobacter roseus]|uniref:Polyphosphate kinase n=1 Tax=Putridiphycobacter roseus TaxID=2219161 RepID=A0A2W1NFR8_9FLAO|nr:polyphosphate kinase 1 [Putridiphycobacter roseus]PZE18335.1 polyphosphate kinase 1 [Putridiphycobacter roseus]